MIGGHKMGINRELRQLFKEQERHREGCQRHLREAALIRLREDQVQACCDDLEQEATRRNRPSEYYGLWR
jgi:hypothetical protein